MMMGMVQRYRFKVDGKVVYFGFTPDLERREREHQVRWPNGRIEPVGGPTKREDAWDWKEQQRTEQRRIPAS